MQEVGHQFSFHFAIPFRRPPSSDGQGTGYSSPGYFDPPDPQGRIFAKGWRYRGRNANPALWIRSQLEYSLSHPFPGWRLRLLRQSTATLSTRRGLLEQDTESAWLNLDPAEETDATPDKAGWALPQILGSSISYRIAVGQQQGRKAFMIRTIRPVDSLTSDWSGWPRPTAFPCTQGSAVRGIKMTSVCAFFVTFPDRP